MISSMAMSQIVPHRVVEVHDASRVHRAWNRPDYPDLDRRVCTASQEACKVEQCCSEHETIEAHFGLTLFHSLQAKEIRLGR